MRGVLAFLLVLAVTATSGMASVLHVHAYQEHHHPEHRHGLAAHQHPTTTDGTQDSVRLEACEPGEHLVSFAYVCAGASLHPLTFDTRTPSPALAAQAPMVVARVGIADVRVHGPPSSRPASLRAPPLKSHA